MTKRVRLTGAQKAKRASMMANRPAPKAPGNIGIPYKKRPKLSGAQRAKLRADKA